MCLLNGFYALIIKLRAKIGAKRHEPDAFYRLILGIVAVHAAAALGQADLEPIAGFITNSPIARSITIP